MARILTAVFVLSFLMGPGPGIYLVNPAPESGRPVAFLGIPVLYLWAVFWFAVMAATVLTAHCKLWREDGE